MYNYIKNKVMKGDQYFLIAIINNLLIYIINYVKFIHKFSWKKVKHNTKY